MLSLDTERFELANQWKKKKKSALNQELLVSKALQADKHIQ